MPKERYLSLTAQEYLSSTEPGSLDFIVGLNLAPSFSNQTQVVYELAYRALSQNGVLLLMGDGVYQPNQEIPGFAVYALIPDHQFAFAGKKKILILPHRRTSVGQICYISICAIQWNSSLQIKSD